MEKAKKAKSLNPALWRWGIIALFVVIVCLHQLSGVEIAIAQISSQNQNKESKDKDGKDSDEIVPGKNLVVMGIPKIPKSLAEDVKKYTGARWVNVAGWHPQKRELWVKGISNILWLNRVESPGGDQKMMVYLNEPDVYDVYFEPKGQNFIYNRDTNGNEAFQMYLYDYSKRKGTLLSDGKSRNTEFVWSNSGKQVAFSYSPENGYGVSLSLINPYEPESNRVIVQSKGNYFKAYDWSPDDRYIVFCEYLSSSDSNLWLFDVVEGEKQILKQRTGKSEYYSYPKFSKDGKGVYLITNCDSEFIQLAYLDLRTKKITYLTANIKWDVDKFEISPDGKTIAFCTNEDGISRLYLLNTITNQQKHVSIIPNGVITELKWHTNSKDLAFDFKSPRTPNDVYTLNIDTGQLELWAKGIPGNIDPEVIVMPSLIHWKSFDGRKISGFIYRPPSRFTGKRPVIIDIHGGPEDQHRPEYLDYDNYYINELGIVKICPNVRGSSGYGKTFLNLDNGVKREDAVRDIGSLLDWIGKQEDLDASRVMVQGGSYGGYLALSVAVKYNSRIKATLSDSGPSNLVTFLERTVGWRQYIRRLEFGDETEKNTRSYMTQIAPINNAEKIKNPLFVIHGKNDPRVPLSDAEAIVNVALKQGTIVWYLLANNEGHSFVNSDNRHFRLYSTILFAKECLLK